MNVSETKTMRELTYKGHTLAINEIPNFGREGELYRGTLIINGEKWVRDSSMVYLIESWFQSHIDNLYKDKTYEEVCQQWGDKSWTKIEYKGRQLYLDATKRTKDNKVVYTGGFYAEAGNYKSKYIRRESIHYDKIVTKFKKYVDEYCTDWRPCTVWGSSFISYNGYTLTFMKEYQVENYLGVCNIHKNSTFKYISNSLKDIEEKFKARIDQILRHKEGVKMVNPKQDRLKQLEAQIAKLQQELEEVKKEKEIFIYKGVTLEYGKEEGLEEGYMIGRVKNAPKGTREFYRKVASNMQVDFEEYIDELEESANLYYQLTGKSINGTT